MSQARLGHRLDGPDDAPVVVFGPSLGADLTMWDEQAGALRDDFRVLRFDHRGHGGSEVPDGPYSVADLGGDVLGLLDRLGVARFSYVGLSLGGIVGQWLAVEAGERLDRLALLCTAPSFPPASEWHDRAALVRRSGCCAVSEAVVGRWLTPAYANRRQETVARLQAMVSATPAEGYAGCCEALAEADMNPILGRIQAPTLVLSGSDDPVAPPATGEALAASISFAESRVVEAAHLANVERSSEVTDLLANHLASSFA